MVTLVKNLLGMKPHLGKGGFLSLSPKEQKKIVRKAAIGAIKEQRKLLEKYEKTTKNK